MAFPIGAAAAVVGSLFSSKSARYGGGDGPLYSTVNGFLARANSGALDVIEQVNSLRKTDADRVQWQLFWDTDLYRANLSLEQRALMSRLDPSKTAGTPKAAAAELPAQTAAAQAASAQPSIVDKIGSAVTQLLGGSSGTPALQPAGTSTEPPREPGMISAPAWFLPAVGAGFAVWLFTRRTPARAR